MGEKMNVVIKHASYRGEKKLTDNGIYVDGFIEPLEERSKGTCV